MYTHIPFHCFLLQLNIYTRSLYLLFVRVDRDILEAMLEMEDCPRGTLRPFLLKKKEEEMEWLKMGKRYVEAGDLKALQARLWEIPEDVDRPWLFQKLYLHACLKGRREIAEWLEGTVFPTLDPIQQIALRQGFAYGRHLLETWERRWKS